METAVGEKRSHYFPSSRRSNQSSFPQSWESKKLICIVKLVCSLELQTLWCHAAQTDTITLMGLILT